MAVRIVPDKDWDIIRKYIDCESVILVKESLIKELNLDEDEVIDHGDGYDFGGEADIWVDVVSNEGHFFLQEMMNKE